MAKKKSKPQKTSFNPISYLKSGNARKLPVYECLLPKDWEEIKEFPLVFSRRHVNGNLTFVSLLVDLFCTGVKDVLFFVNEPESTYRELIRGYEDSLMLEYLPVSYELIHNIIFESVAFAEEYGIAPHEDFRFAELILEEDSDDFPKMDVPLGEDNIAHLYLDMEDERADYFERQILKYGKPGTYKIIREDFEEDDDFDEFEDRFYDSCFSWDEVDWEDFYVEADFEDLPEDILLFTLSMLPGYFYPDLREEKLFSPFTKVLTTEKPTSNTSFGKQEMSYMEKAYGKLNDMEIDEESPAFLEFIEKGIEKWPANRVLWQYKWEYFQRWGKIEKSVQVALEIKSKFPDYLFGLSCHAQSIIELGEVDAIPEAMNDCHKIQDFDPKRKKFHKSELQSFYSPWIYYYSKTGQLRAAYFLVNLLAEHEVLLEYPFHYLVNDAYMQAVDKVVYAYYEKVKSGKVSKEEFLGMILGE
ncbi:hypothetical protein [Aquiflexum sp.]|uniref:hypothetical protein n=1 Tax=Aquiflexum sp. TaxID=1872584 RepID=UPI00359311F2